MRRLDGRVEQLVDGHGLGHEGACWGLDLLVLPGAEVAKFATTRYGAGQGLV